MQNCPRCNGHVIDTGDMYGPYRACLQCGWHSPDGQASVMLSEVCAIIAEPPAPIISLIAGTGRRTRKYIEQA